MNGTPGCDLTGFYLTVATEGSQPVATVNPPVLTVQQGQRVEFRCSVTGNPTPAVEWIGEPNLLLRKRMHGHHGYVK